MGHWVQFLGRLAMRAYRMLLTGLVVGMLGTASAGMLVVIGGALEPDNAPIYRAVVDGAGGKPICVLGTASAEPEASAASYVEDFRGYGAEAEAVAITVDNANRSTRDGAVLGQLEGCGGYFFVGGDQNRITEALLGYQGDTPALATIRGAFTRGAVIAGTSAGAAMMSRVMIGGGTSLDTLTGGADEVLLTEGLSFEDSVIFDQHFIERGRLGRLVGALMRSDLTLGAGVGEDTALIVPESGPWRVVGSGHVAILELGDGVRLERVAGVEMSLLADGDAFDPESGQFSVAGTREDIAEVGYYYDAGTILAVDVFGPGVLADLAEQLVDSPESEASGLAFGGEPTARFTSDGVRLVLAKGPDTVGYWGDVDVGEGYSIVRLGLETSPITVTVAPADAP